MSIDFSKAPEGATHYLCTQDTTLWYAAVDGVLEIWDEAGGEWCLSCREYGGEWCKSLTALPTFEPFVSVEDAPHTGDHDPVNRPAHYASGGGVECIEAIKASMSRESFLGYLKGNVQKYLWRYEKKVNPVEDLKKARWYLDRLIAEQE